ncbi:dehydrogenase/reductase SDR family member 8 precursor [Trichosporon asahii var. asahii CBS 2479]|uniref:Short-chain dehydrogenase/reductase 3 n=1 Tax=Trichosporon asahii var. asahii (strain ATCC 90039 / CBS 2479 / JCM 2466 / KCTC 7840 / NBRC 103889/ NCYC 2677 / UAMH 7654) TaxID=1186058 RepID=J6ENK9_TRIAS|nr:dehydrogenase/reductase SDR family member 8 precursor [Trichosporon asahii var. asahii CBS 2479]EJT45954.1 dehydrogenase/reductase SDR family member 8 precursor [Trichosporon asahii var. asahii CBS 2479]
MNALYAVADSPVAKLVDALKNYIVLNPAVSGALLLLLAGKGPEGLQEKLHEVLAHIPYDESTIKLALQILFGVGLVRNVNSKLSELAQNNWRWGPAPGWNWPQEIAIVTGGSSGIGLGITERFAAKGIKVAVLDVQDFPKAKLAPNVKFYKTDITDPVALKKSADQVRRDFGEPTILINNAGVTRPSTILDISHEFLNTIFKVNTICHWTTVKEFLPAMVKRNHGHVVTIASVASFVPLPGGADYSSTKASALAFHEALGAEIKFAYKAPNVLTSIIHPNFVNTPLVADFKHVLDKGGIAFLTTDRVADDIVNHVYKRKSDQVIIPGSSTFLSTVRSWSNWLQIIVRSAAAKGLNERV